MPELDLPDPADRENLGAFVARAVRLDTAVLVRLRSRGDDLVDAWASTPFDVLATRTVHGAVTPGDITVSGNELLAALAVVGGRRVDPGPPRDIMWHSPLPPATGWSPVDNPPLEVLTELVDKGVALARENAGPKGNPPASLLDQQVLTVAGSGYQVRIPMRCLFAMSGMGLLDKQDTVDSVKVSATDSWMRIDAFFGAVVRRRHALLPLLV